MPFLPASTATTTTTAVKEKRRVATTPLTSIANLYIPRIYGFRVSERARSGPRMQWLRMRPQEGEMDWGREGDDYVEEEDEGDKADEEDGDDPLDPVEGKKIDVTKVGVEGKGQQTTTATIATTTMTNAATSPANRIYRPLPAPRTSTSSPATIIVTPSAISPPTPTTISTTTFDFKSINLPDGGVFGAKVKDGLQAIRVRVKNSLEEKDTAAAAVIV